MSKALIFTSLLLLLLPGVFFTQTPTPTPNERKLGLPKKPEKPPVTAEDFVEAARWVEYHENDYKTALAYLDRALELDPDLLKAIWFRALFKADSGDCKSAIDDYSIVIVRSQDPVNTYQYRG